MRGNLILAAWLPGLTALAVSAVAQVAPPAPDAFALHDGDRVVLVGDGLIERAQHYGFVELALTTRWPNRNVTFRNVGWSGDTVFGEARDHYTNPPTAFDHLIEQITTPRPTVTVFGYGGAMAYEAPDAIPAFVEGYHRLLDTLGVAGARCVLLAPAPHEQRASPHPDVASLNARLEATRDAIAGVAADRRCWFVDVFAGLQERYRSRETPLTTNGIHLDEAGYIQVARLLEDDLAQAPRSTLVVVDFESGVAHGARLVQGIEIVDLGERSIQNPGPSNVGITYRFNLIAEALPMEGSRVLIIKGLGQGGSYTLSSGGVVLAQAPAEVWANGVRITHPVERTQVEALRRAIIEKNQLYFRQYRPQNETYLVGFRRYEQGQNADELGQLDPLIGEKENEIGRLRVPQALVFTLTRQ